MDSIPQITCTGCAKPFPATTEFFHKSRLGKYGLRSICKICLSEYYRLRRDEKREYDRQYRKVNAEKIRAQQRQRAQKNPEKKREYSQRYYKKHTERILERCRQWRAEHPDSWQRYYAENAEKRRENTLRYAQQNPERVRVQQRQWQINNPEKVRERNRRRRAKKRNLPSTFTAEHEQFALDYFNGCCAVCERPLRDLFGTHTAHFDHWIPLSKGGATAPDNMIPLCGGQGGCNNSKGDKLPVDWLNHKFTPRKAKAILERIETYLEQVKRL